MTMLRNVLLACGAYFVAAWLLVPLVLLWNFVSSRLSFTEGIESMVLMPIVMGVPEIVVASGVGAAVAATVQATRPSRWALIPAALFVMQHVLTPRWWAQPPTTTDRITLAIEAALPAVACVLSATIFERRLRRTPAGHALHLTAAIDVPDGRR